MHHHSLADADGTPAVRYRLINQTRLCISPRLVIFQSEPPSGVGWAEIPASWLSSDGRYIHLIIAKGTLIPAVHKDRGQKALLRGAFEPAAGKASLDLPSKRSR